MPEVVRPSISALLWSARVGAWRIGKSEPRSRQSIARCFECDDRQAKCHAKQTADGATQGVAC